MKKVYRVSTWPPSMSSAIWMSQQMAKTNRCGVEMQYQFTGNLPPIVPPPSLGFSAGSWEASVWFSEKIKGMSNDRVHKLNRLFASMPRLAAPDFFFASNLLPAFAGWEGKIIDLHLEAYPRPIEHKRIIGTYEGGGAVALLKDGRWFALRALRRPPKLSPGDVEIVFLTAEQAGRMVRLPKDWETKVEIIPREGVL